MRSLGELVREAIDAGLDPAMAAELLAEAHSIGAESTTGSGRTARQERNRRYYERRKHGVTAPGNASGKRLNASDSDDSDASAEPPSPEPPSQETPLPQEKGSLSRAPQKKGVPPGKRDVHEAFEAYNETAARLRLPAARKLTADRQRGITARLAEHGLSGWLEALAQIEHGPHLLGQNDRGWKLDLEFLCRPGKFNRVLEGSYSGPGPPQDPLMAACDAQIERYRSTDDEQTDFHEGGLVLDLRAGDES